MTSFLVAVLCQENTHTGVIYSTSLFLISYYKEALPGTIPVLVYDLCPYVWGPQDVGMYLQVFFLAGIPKKSKDQRIIVLQ